MAGEKFTKGDKVWVNGSCPQQVEIIDIRKHPLTGETVYHFKMLSHWYLPNSLGYAIEKLVFATREEAARHSEVK